MSQLDLITKALRIGAFSGLAITIFALATDSNWLLENKYLIKPKDKDLNELDIDELKSRGTNYVSYLPETFFKEQDLQKLGELKAKLKEIQNEIEIKRDELSLPTDESISIAYKGYMETLHRYNEAKDTAQALIGRLAQLTGTTTKELYPSFNLSIDD